MSRPIGDALPDIVVEMLPGGHPCAVATVAQDGRPYLCLMAGVVAISPTTLRLGCWGAGTTVANIRREGTVTIETLGPKAISIQCDARILKEPMDASMFPPHPYVLVDATVRNVKDDAPPGLLIEPLRYDYGTRADRLLSLEAAFLDELRNAPARGTGDAA